MPRAVNITVQTLRARGTKQHEALAKLTAEYNATVSCLQTLKQVREDLSAGDLIKVQDDLCQVLHVPEVTSDDPIAIRVLRKCNEPLEAFVDSVKDFNIHTLVQVSKYEALSGKSADTAGEEVEDDHY